MKRLEGRRCRVVVAMSGGVDSSTVAGLLAEAGHEVIGVSMKLYDRGDVNGSGAFAGAVAGASSEGSCCSLDDVDDARRVAAHLGIPFYVGNYVEVFREAVVARFVEAYKSGRTPNPCVRCNDDVKFRALLDRARALGADFLATGHYARTVVDERGRVSLWRGLDPVKDQSYFLAGIPVGALDRVVFPLGGLEKSEVRAHAERLGLPVHAKAESQEICFVPDGDYARFVERAAGADLAGPGDIVDLEGQRLGRHSGLHRYTVGQRRGIAVAGVEPRYVVELRPGEANTLVVGGADDVLAQGLWAERPHWLGEAPEPAARVVARIRHSHAGSSARVVEVSTERVVVRFDEPVRAVAPGQQLVLYAGERVLGAGTIGGGERARTREGMVQGG